MKVRLQAVCGARSMTVVSAGVVTVLFADHSRFVRAPFITHVSYTRIFIHS